MRDRCPVDLSKAAGPGSAGPSASSPSRARSIGEVDGRSRGDREVGSSASRPMGNCIRRPVRSLATSGRHSKSAPDDWQLSSGVDHAECCCPPCDLCLKFSRGFGALAQLGRADAGPRTPRRARRGRGLGRPVRRPLRYRPPLTMTHGTRPSQHPRDGDRTGADRLGVGDRDAAWWERHVTPSGSPLPTNGAACRRPRSSRPLDRVLPRARSARPGLAAATDLRRAARRAPELHRLVPAGRPPGTATRVRSRSMLTGSPRRR